MLTRKYRIDEICAALGYNSDCVPKSGESIYKVQAACKSTPVSLFDPDFEILVPSSFQSNDGPFTSGEVKGISIKSCLTPESSIEVPSYDQGLRSEPLMY